MVAEKRQDMPYIIYIDYNLKRVAYVSAFEIVGDKFQIVNSSALPLTIAFQFINQISQRRDKNQQVTRGLHIIYKKNVSIALARVTRELVGFHIQWGLESWRPIDAGGLP